MNTQPRLCHCVPLICCDPWHYINESYLIHLTDLLIDWLWLEWSIDCVVLKVIMSGCGRQMNIFRMRWYWLTWTLARPTRWGLLLRTAMAMKQLLSGWSSTHQESVSLHCWSSDLYSSFLSISLIIPTITCTAAAAVAAVVTETFMLLIYTVCMKLIDAIQDSLKLSSVA